MENNKEFEKLFKSVWNNIYLFKHIYNFAKLYKKNEVVIFYDLTTLRKYKEREFITKLVYRGVQKLKNGDIPSSLVIREIELTKIELLSTPGEFIPNGVEILTYSNFGWCNLTKLSKKLKSVPLSTLPTSIHTINNAVILLQPTENVIIPPNIKSISITNSPLITKVPDSSSPYLKIPNTIRSLEFKDKSYLFNNNAQLTPGDIPNGITKLSINSCRFGMKFGIIPESVTDLSFNQNHLGTYFKIDPALVLLESLRVGFISQKFQDITNLSNLIQLHHLKKLTISMGYRGKVHPNSIPSSVRELKLCNELQKMYFGNGLIPHGVEKLTLSSGHLNLLPKCIPDSVTTLIISNPCFSITKQLDKKNIFPSSLTHLEILSSQFSLDEFIKFIPLLPQSITTIVLPWHWTNKKLNLPCTIKNISFTKKTKRENLVFSLGLGN